jgi:Leucine-rich repeat (LRR) protein
LATLVFDKELPQLESLDLSYSDITAVTGLEKLPALKTLNLYSTTKLATLVFDKELPQLETLNLSYSGITAITGLEKLPQLKNLYLANTAKLQKLIFPASSKSEALLERLKSLKAPQNKIFFE